VPPTPTVPTGPDKWLELRECLPKSKRHVISGFVYYEAVIDALDNNLEAIREACQHFQYLSECVRAVLQGEFWDGTVPRDRVEQLLDSLEIVLSKGWARLLVSKPADKAANQPPSTPAASAGNVAATTSTSATTAGGVVATPSTPAATASTSAATAGVVAATASTSPATCSAPTQPPSTPAATGRAATQPPSTPAATAFLCHDHAHCIS